MEILGPISRLIEEPKERINSREIPYSQLGRYFLKGHAELPS